MLYEFQSLNSLCCTSVTVRCKNGGLSPVVKEFNRLFGFYVTFNTVSANLYY